MSTVCGRPAFAGLPELWSTHRRIPGRAGFGRVGTALLRGRQWLDGLRRRRRRIPGDGGSHPPDDQPRSVSIWDDPDLWMLMIH
jgi:hypothetical protein